MTSKWEPYRLRITDFYRVQRKSLDEIIATMEKEGFYASKSGYERQLKAWGIRKYTDRKILVSAKLKVEQRERRGLSSQILVRGRLLSKLDIDQATARCFIPSSVRFGRNDVETAPDVIAITPTSEGYMACIRTRDLPFIDFIVKLPPMRHLHMLLDIPLEVVKTIVAAIVPWASVRSRTSPLGYSPPSDMELINDTLTAVLPIQRHEDSLEVLGNIVFCNSLSTSIELLKIMMFLMSNNILMPPEHFEVSDSLLRWFQMGDNHLVMKQILLYNTPTMEAFAESMFNSAIYLGDCRIVQLLLETGFTPETIIVDRVMLDEVMNVLETCTAFQLAIATGNLELFRLFLDPRFSTNLDYSACHKTWEESTKEGLSTIGRRTPLGIASAGGHLGIVQELLEHGASVATIDTNGAAALHRAASGRHTKIAKMLLDKGADIDARSPVHGSPLECAIRQNAPSIVDLLLSRGANVNGLLQPAHHTPLQTAVMMDELALVQRLLRMGAHINAPAPRLKQRRGEEAATALQWAAHNGNIQMCQILLQAKSEAGINISPRCLLSAVQSGNLEVVKLFLRLNVQTHGIESREAMLHITMSEALRIKSYRPEILEWIMSMHPKLGKSFIQAPKLSNLQLLKASIRAGADVNAIDGQGLCPLSKAVASKNHACVRRLLNAGARPNPKKRVPLRLFPFYIPVVLAALDADIRLLEMLIMAGADPNTYGYLPPSVGYQNTHVHGTLTYATALQAASWVGNIAMAQYLLRAGAQISASAHAKGGMTALEAAAKSQNHELVHLLIQHISESNISATETLLYDALRAAVVIRDVESVRLLFAAGARIGVGEVATSSFRRTLLGIAAKNGDNDLVSLLLDHGARINMCSVRFTPLQVAAFKGNSSTVRLLLEKGADPNAPAAKKDECTALQAAALGGFLHIADLLVRAGADVNAPKSEHGSTALAAAASEGRIDMIKFLLNAGADITSDFGRTQLETAIDYALRWGHNAAAKFLKYHQLS